MTTDSLDFSWLENVPCRTRKNIQWSTLPRVTSGSAVLTSKLTSVSSKMSSTMTWSKKPLAPFNHNRTIANLSPILPKKRFLVPLTPSKSCECLTPKTPSSVRRYSTVWKFYDFTCTQILCEIRPWVGILGTKARKKKELIFWKLDRAPRGNAQCGNFGIYPSLRFCVKLILEYLNVPKMSFLSF